MYSIIILTGIVFLSVIILVQSYFTFACGEDSALRVHSCKYSIVGENKILTLTDPIIKSS